MIHAVINLNKDPDFKDFKNELDCFDDIIFNDKKQISLTYNSNHIADSVFNEEYNMSLGEIHAVNMLGKISRKHKATVTFWT